MTKKINITLQNINYGKQGCKNNCPIALALKRDYKTKNVEVDVDDTGENLISIVSTNGATEQFATINKVA